MTMRERTGRPWTKHELALLGTMSDAELARRKGRTPLAVRQQRVRLGIAAHQRQRAWTAEEDRLLRERELSAVELAERYGRTVAAVYTRRHLLSRLKAV